MISSRTHDPEGAVSVPRSRKAIRVWLHAIALLIVAMIVVGGATRLTDSGLSITEWQPIRGVLPPLDEAEWEEEFAKYRQIPQYEAVNKGMTISEYKTIFWWEWAHRLLGRVIGVVFFLPLVFFWATGRIEPGLKTPLVVILALGGLQGAIGWWMVASGLTERTDVSQYRLAVHLTLACAILAYVVWVARGLAPVRAPGAGRGLRSVASLIVALIILQIFLGGLVAGLNAGMTFNTWPLMDGAIIPSGLFMQELAWRNLFENAATVQFNHRMVAYGLFAVALTHAFQARRTGHGRTALLLAILVTSQAAVGIATLLLVVPLHAALTHQIGAVIVLWIAVVHLRGMVTAPGAPLLSSVQATERQSGRQGLDLPTG